MEDRIEIVLISCAMTSTGLILLSAPLPVLGWRWQTAIEPDFERRMQSLEIRSKSKARTGVHNLANGNSYSTVERLTLVSRRYQTW
jgi:hypothetical protein